MSEADDLPPTVPLSCAIEYIRTAKQRLPEDDADVRGLDEITDSLDHIRERYTE